MPNFIDALEDTTGNGNGNESTPANVSPDTFSSDALDALLSGPSDSGVQPEPVADLDDDALLAAIGTPPIGHNNPPTDFSDMTMEDFEQLGVDIANDMAKVESQTDKMGDLAEKAKSMREQAAAKLYPVFDYLGLNNYRGREGRAFSDACKEHVEYGKVADAFCEQLSKKLKDEIEYSTKGLPKYSIRVKKAWSRILVSYRDEGNGGQTEADKAAREAAKERNTLIKEMGKMMVTILGEYGKNTDEGAEMVNTLLASAHAQFGGRIAILG